MALQMLSVAALAVNVHHALSDSSVGFAIAYAISRLLLVLEYLWAGWHIPMARGLTYRYALGFSIGASFWIISAFVPLSWRFGLWAVGLAVDFATPLTAQAAIKQLPPHPEHLPERFGLFTIIVLGEAILAVVNGISDMKWGVASTASAIAGFVIAFSLWWIYFENVSGSVLETARAPGRLQIVQFWLYVHLPLVIGIAATGVGVDQGSSGCRPINARALADLRVGGNLLQFPGGSASNGCDFLLQGPNPPSFRRDGCNAGFGDRWQHIFAAANRHCDCDRWASSSRS
jgi:low temperature requirement protein LtrA